MKRPRFFEDLDRSISGEPEYVEPPFRVDSDLQIALLQAQAMRQCDLVAQAQLQQQAQWQGRPYSSSGMIGGALGDLLDGVFGRTKN